MTKSNKEIIVEELEKIHGEYMVAKALAIKSGEYYKNEDEWKNKFFEPLASTLLSKLNRLDRRKIKKIISKYTKPNMLQWTHQIDKTKPVASCFYSTEDYKNCIEEICQLIPEEGEVIAEGKILACPWLKYDIGDIRIDVRFRKRKNKINKILRDLVKKNKKIKIIIREVKQ